MNNSSIHENAMLFAEAQELKEKLKQTIYNQSHNVINENTNIQNEYCNSTLLFLYQEHDNE